MTQSGNNSINDIIDRLEELSIESGALLIELRRARLRERQQDQGSLERGAVHPVTPPRQTSTFPHGFELGDTVVITNNYLGQRNTRGHVSYITAQRVTIIDAHGQRYTRKPTNLRKLYNDQ